MVSVTNDVNRNGTASILIELERRRVEVNLDAP